MAAVHTFSADVDSLFTTTLSVIRPRLADAVFKQNPFLAWMMMRGRVDFEGGGYDIREPIIWQKNPTVMSYSGFDRLNVTPNDPITEAIYQWKLKAGTVSVSGQESVVQNAGAQALIKLLRAKVTILENTMRESMNEDLISVASLKGSKDVLGLDNYMEQGSYGTVGGIDGNTHSWWRNKWDTGNDSDILGEMRRMYNDCTKGGRRPDLILMPQTKFENYEREYISPQADQASGTVPGTVVASKAQGSMDMRLIDMGFQNFAFKGARIMWDEQLENVDIRPAAQDREIIYFIHSDSMSMTVHRNRNFVFKPFREPYDQDAKVAKLLFAGNLTARNRRNLGALYLT